jgi:hypothetical protein
MDGVSDFPTDDATLVMLIAACEINPDTGRTHLFDFLDMGSVIKSVEDITEETFGEDDEEGARVYFVEHEDGREPFSPHDVIRTLAQTILNMRAAA